MAVTPTLYIMMRTDIADMNPGKGFAQAAHAASDFEAWASSIEPTSPAALVVAAWREDRNFGRTLSVAATLADIEQIVSMDTASGITVDPTYPWRNHYGQLFLTEEVTCGWLFVDHLTSRAVLETIKLLPLHQ